MAKKSKTPARATKPRIRELTAEDARWRLKGDERIAPTTVGLPPTNGIIGQERALKALKLGLELYSPGYNVFVCGVTGTGRTSTVQRMLAGIRPQCALADDLCYVQNFLEPERPLLIVLPRGKAPEFRETSQRAAKALRDEVLALMNSEEVAKGRRQIEEKYRARAAEAGRDAERIMEESGLALLENPDAPGRSFFVARVDENEIAIDDLEKAVAEKLVTAERAEALRAKAEAAERAVEDAEFKRQQIVFECQAGITAFEGDAVKGCIQGFIQQIRACHTNEKIEGWLSQVEKAVVENLELFHRSRPGTEEAQGGASEGPDMGVFEVNVVLSSKEGGCPTIIENHPTHQNLFGSQDRVQIQPGVYGTDFSRIKAGSLLKAQGGYLIINASDVLQDEAVWTQLKRTLRSRQLVIQPPESQQTGGAPVLNPEPIPINVKVIMLGNSPLYDLLHEGDADFSQIFKIKADFDDSVDMTPEVLTTYVGVLVRIIREDGLLDLDRDALEEVLQYSMRIAGRRGRLTIRFSPLADMLREATYIARSEGSALVTAPHVARSIHDTWQRSNLIEEKLIEQIADGTQRISVEGSAIGQINGLTVLTVGEYSFGMPARITCTTAAGRSGLISIERESEMSGSSHEKGVQILQGFLRGRYAQQVPLTLAASICFEQSYAIIDGDSASTAEAIAIISSLARSPLRQDLAVTGAIDQFGAVQPVGGINEKVEGFYLSCKAKGLTGTQGVLLPETNVRELMLRGEVVKAIRERRFHLFPISTVDQAIELLTGKPPGEQGANGIWTPKSINRMVQDRLRELYEAALPRYLEG